MTNAAQRERYVRGRLLARLLLLLGLTLLLASCALTDQATPTPTATIIERPLSPTRQPSPTLPPAASPTLPPTPQPTATSAAPTATSLLPTVTPTARPPTATPTLTATPLPPTATLTPSPVPPAPTATPLLDPVCYASSGRLKLYAGPDPSYDVVVVLGLNEEVRPLARTADARWLQVVTLDGIQGWFAADLGRCQYLDLGRLLIVNVPATPTAVPTSTPPPTPTALVITDWRGEYYTTTDLSGSPAVVRNDSTISFSWGEGAPAPGIPADTFSVRWTRTLEFGAGDYRFNLNADDGARLFIDDILVIDMWELGSARTRSAVVSLPGGARRLRVEYFENSGSATCSMWWETAQFLGWRGEYYTNANLSGSPALVRDDPVIDFTWGVGAAAAGLPGDNFSVRWTRDVDFEGGAYRLTVNVDDGVRIWLDGALIMDEWRLGSATYVRDLTVTPGRHNVRVEYFEATGDARLTWAWDRSAAVYPNYRGEYFNNDALAGAPLLVRNDTVLDFIWGESAPDARLNPALFSVRWTGQPFIGQGLYRLRAEADDGVRVWIDGGLVIDAWRQGAVAEQVNVMISPSGRHDVRVEYFQRGGSARLHVWWTPQPGPVAH